MTAAAAAVSLHEQTGQLFCLLAVEFDEAASADD
jgi:hypothetical protein